MRGLHSSCDVPAENNNTINLFIVKVVKGEIFKVFKTTENFFPGSYPHGDKTSIDFQHRVNSAIKKYELVISVSQFVHYFVCRLNYRELDDVFCSIFVVKKKIKSFPNSRSVPFPFGLLWKIPDCTWIWFPDWTGDWIPDSRSKKMLDSGFRIPLGGLILLQN